MLGLASIRLITNNPDKVAQPRAYGVTVRGRIPHVMPASPHSLFYLQTKRERSGHLLPPFGEGR